LHRIAKRLYNLINYHDKYGGIMDEKQNNVNNFWLLYRDVGVRLGILEKNYWTFLDQRRRAVSM